MFLNYLSLAILLAGLTAVFYTFIYIHDIPHHIAKRRNHPQEEAIGVAGWLSLFTLHAIWPIVFIWAISKQGPEGTVGLSSAKQDSDLARRFGELEDKLHKLEKQLLEASTKSGKS